MFGLPIAASTQRAPGTLALGQTAVWTTHLTSLICRQSFGTLLQAVNQQVAVQAFGITGNVQQLRKVYADWPRDANNNAVTEDFPVRPGDRLVLPQGTYSIKGVKPHPGHYLELYVETPVA